MTQCRLAIHRVPEKNRTDNIVAVTLTNLDNFSQFLAQIILTVRVTGKNCKIYQYLQDTT